MNQNERLSLENGELLKDRTVDDYYDWLLSLEEYVPHFLTQNDYDLAVSSISGYVNFLGGSV
jgi:hypothetical protein